LVAELQHGRGDTKGDGKPPSRQPRPLRQRADKAAETAKTGHNRCGQDTAGKVANRARDAWAALGKFFSKKLPSVSSSTSLSSAWKTKLIGFIEDAGRRGRRQDLVLL